MTVGQGRDVAALALGVLAGLYEIFLDHPVRLEILLFSGACLGIPLALART
jgi:hypothetical protein